MAIYKENIVDIDLGKGQIHRAFLNHSIGMYDQQADRFGIRVFRDGEPVNLTGVSVQGVFMPPQGSPIAITSGNIVSENVAEVILPQACYNYEGAFTLAIKLVDSTNEVTGTVRIVDGMVDNTHASGTVAPTDAVPTYQEILAVYDEMLQDVTDYESVVANQDAKIDDIKRAYSKQPFSNVKVIDGRKAVNTNTAFEQGNFNSSGDVADNTQVRTGFIRGGVYIVNPDQYQQFAVLETTEDHTGTGYYAGTVAGTGSGYYKDETLYLPKKTTGFYRIKSKKFVGETQVPVTPETNAIGLFALTNEKIQPDPFDDAKVINGEMVYNTETAFEQGTFTSSANVNSTNEIRTGWIRGGVFIVNPNQVQEYAIMRVDESKTYDVYIAGTVAGTSTNYYKDEVLFIPKLKAGYYRIRTKRYASSGVLLSPFSPYDNQLCLYAPVVGDGYEQGAVSSSGFSYSNKNVITGYLQTKGYEGLYIRIKNSNYQYAVYSTTNDGTSFSAETSGYVTNPTRFKDDTKKYVVRINPVAGVTYNYNDAIKALDIVLSPVQFGYKRDYDDITYSLVWQRKSIGTVSGITDSTTRLIAKLPNAGNVEVKMNTPNSRFIVFKENPSSNSFEQLTGWSHYFYRYTGDPAFNYYVMTRYETESTITEDAGALCVKVYIYDDVGEKYDDFHPWYGKNIAVFGDSIVQGRFRKNVDSGTNSTAAKPYANLIAERCNTEGGDFGIGGAPVYGTGWNTLYTNKGNVTGYDIVLVCAGTNDFGANVPESDFKTAYGSVIDTLLTNNTTVIAITPTVRSTNNANTISKYLSDYAQWVRDVAETKGIDVIDLYEMTNISEMFKANLSDGLHPNEVGQAIMCDMVMSAAKELT